MACFADINVSQGSVATYARCGRIFNTRLTANLPRNLPVQKFCKSVKIWQNYGHESVAPFLAHPVGMWDRFESAPAPLQSPVRSVQFAGDDGAADDGTSARRAAISAWNDDADVSRLPLYDHNSRAPCSGRWVGGCECVDGHGAR